MIECEFLVQENNFESATERKLEQGTKEVVKKILNTDASVSWQRVLDGNGFTAGEGGSKSSLILFVVPKDTTDETRSELLAAVCTLWIDTAGCHKNDLMISAFDDNLLS
jgi:hypothetical protein